MAVNSLPQLQQVPGSTPELDPTTPLETSVPRLERPATVAGGVPAVLSTTRYMRRETTLGTGLKVLRTINQVEGFDCPSCAWPDPEQRSVVEFCENGARAVLDEATKKRVGPEFFAQHSVADLLQQSDAWLNAQGRITHPMLLDPGDDHYRAVSWDDAFALIADELRARQSPDQARSTRRAAQQRSGVSVPAARPHVRHEQLSRLLEHVPRVERQRACSRSIGVGKGSSRSLTSSTPT